VAEIETLLERIRKHGQRAYYSLTLPEFLYPTVFSTGMVKQLISFITILFFVSATSIAQDKQIEYILNTTKLVDQKVNPKDTSEAVYLQVPFARWEIMNPEAIKKLKKSSILSIDLVYTSFREVESFDQRELNKKRLMALKTLSPKWFSEPTIEWRVIAQHDSIKSTAYGTFNGFVVKVRRPAGDAALKMEMAELKRILDCETKGKKDTAAVIVAKVSAASTGRNKTDGNRNKKAKVKAFYKIRVEPKFAGDPSGKALYKHYAEQIDFKKLKKTEELTTDKYLEYTFYVNADGEVYDAAPLTAGISEYTNSEVISVINSTPNWKAGKTNGNTLQYKIGFVFTSKKEKLPYTDKKSNVRVMNLDLVEVLDTSHILTRKYPRYDDFPCKPKDKTVYKAFLENPQWNNILVVSDFTGSMATYNQQLLLWFKLNLEGQKKFKHFTFFNDGDKKSDRMKLVGNTGGIYHSDSISFTAIERMVNLVTKNGNGGGDAPENDMEAIIAGMRKCKDCKDIVWIADNYATPRDLVLMSKIGKPVHVILCGTSGGINLRILDFVYKNKGTLHTLDEQMNELAKLKEGEIVSIGNRDYRIKKGRFEVVF
jgi:hypothetical protein